MLTFQGYQGFFGLVKVLIVIRFHSTFSCFCISMIFLLFLELSEEEKIYMYIIYKYILGLESLLITKRQQNNKN